MSNFWNLVSFEFKKIFRKKSVILTLLLSAIVVVLSSGIILFSGNYYINGEKFATHYEMMLQDREYAQQLSGRTLDTPLLMETAQAYATIPADASPYVASEEYQTNARPYSYIWRMMQSVYGSVGDRFEVEDAKDFTPELAAKFDTIWKEGQKNYFSDTISEGQKNYLHTQINQINTPLTFEYADGYWQTYSMVYTAAIVSCFAIAVCVAPIFAGEYTSKVSQLILSSKKGKSTVVLAKIFTGLSAGVIIAAGAVLLNDITLLCIYGTGGAGSAVQIYNIMMPYALTAAQVTIVQGICAVAGGLFAAAIIMALSAKLKTPFGVLGIFSVILIAPMFINPPDIKWVEQLLALLPGEMSAIWNVVWEPYDLFGLILRPYVFIPIFALLAAGGLGYIAYKGFQKYQGA